MKTNVPGCSRNHTPGQWAQQAVCVLSLQTAESLKPSAEFSRLTVYCWEGSLLNQTRSRADRSLGMVCRPAETWVPVRTGWPGIRASTYVCTLGTGAQPALLILALQNVCQNHHDLRSGVIAFAKNRPTKVVTSHAGFFSRTSLGTCEEGTYRNDKMETRKIQISMTGYTGSLYVIAVDNRRKYSTH